eukprot:1195097-Prorocentrum_minimum.AAC.1
MCTFSSGKWTPSPPPAVRPPPSYTPPTPLLVPPHTACIPDFTFIGDQRPEPESMPEPIDPLRTVHPYYLIATFSRGPRLAGVDNT